MYPQPPQYSPTAYLRQFPVPGEVRSVAVMLWTTAGISFVALAASVAIAAMADIDFAFAFGSLSVYSMPNVLLGVLAVVPAVSVTRGRSWARTMAKVVLIIQIVLQSMALAVMSVPAPFWALFLLPVAIVGVVLLHRPVAKRFFAAHGQAADQEYTQQYVAQQWGQGQYSPQQPYPAQQGYGHRPPQNGAWGQYPHQR